MFRLRTKINLDELSLAFMILGQCSVWLLEDILNMHLLILLVSAVSFAVLLIKRKASIVSGGWVFLLYLLGVYLSLGFNGGSIRAIYRFAQIVFILLYVNVADFETETLAFTKKGLVLTTYLAVVFILLQFVLKDAFSDPFYNLLSANSRTDALHYYDRGYYSGIIIKPHEAAGFISVTMAALLMDGWLKNRKSQMIMALFFAIPLLLTGKRAIFVFTFGALLCVYAFTQMANRKVLKTLAIALVAAILGILAVVVIMANAENPLFARFAKLISKASESLIDETRLNLWRDAWNLWLANPLFGVGWRNFPELTITLLDYPRSHSVNLDYLQFLCETGIVGFVLMMTPVIFMACRTWILGKYAAKEELPHEQKLLIYLAFYIQVFILVYALVEVPFYSTMYFALYIYSCIIVNSYYTKLPVSVRGRNVRFVFGMGKN